MSLVTKPPATKPPAPVDRSRSPGQPLSQRNKEKGHALGLTSATGLVIGSIEGPEGTTVAPGAEQFEPVR